MGSIEPFNRLVKLAARAFYDDVSTNSENQGKNGRSDNRGIAVVILDALTRRQWVREEDLAKDLKIHTKQLRRTLRFFEEEKLVIRYDRKEVAKGAKIDSLRTGREGEEKIKMHTHSYCCLDYAQLYDVVRYRIHRMKKKLKDEMKSKNAVQVYICPNCRRRYNALDSLGLISPYDEDFHCESCNGVLVAEIETLAAQELGNGVDKSKPHRHENSKEMLTKMEEQLKPLTDQLARVKDLPVPEFGSFQAWELKANAVARSDNGDCNANDPSRSSQGLGFGDIKVEVVFSAIDKKGDNIKSENAKAPTKIAISWFTKEGRNLTKEQLEETKAEIKPTSTTSTPIESSDEKKHVAVVYNTPTERQVGVKSKRSGDYAGDDVAWEAPPPTGGRVDRFNVEDVNVEVEAEVSEDDDDGMWVEG
ncbi:hypothetical protein ABFS82_13G021300 [Erythranthe guttata]|uniref:transcription initiation factor IIE subunit alpha-like n=1 Tax=Erythranthe guttata TaxID=4155 RepID=UPI00064DAF28|nr:PREDICTED: transcription initiation factor IIE subunit alpha-like [Erythranthe guttata]|eukprot:XP_012852503.1 PREDICTED: transcription initiation factor IIE subunit alpha-like [Erythranthe guttata]